MKTIVLTVIPDGSSRMETHGFSGSECRDASRFMQQALGLTQREHLTADFYRQNVSESQQTREQQ